MSRFAIPILALLTASANPAAAQETRVAPEGHTPPRADIGQVAWLVGRWTGEGVGGAPAHESWLPPVGGTMVGTFVQENADGTIMFTEHMYLMEEEGSLVVKLKHFEPDLTGWEDKEGMVTFRLLSAEPCAAYFQALTYRCTTAEEGEGGLVVAVRMKSDGPDFQELGFSFRRMSTAPEISRCPDAMTTLQINVCLGELLEEAENRQVIYRQAAIEKNAERLELTEAILASDEAFNTYRERECDAVYADWAGGSIRYTMALSCKIDLTDRRTHRIWENWLTYMDSTPPILPEPQPTQ